MHRCGSNAFAAWENKLYVVLCGGIPGVEIRTVQKVVLSIGIELPTEDFFDEHYLVRNMASLFGIPASRMRVPKIVAGSTRRRLEAGTSAVAVDLAVEAQKSWLKSGSLPAPEQRPVAPTGPSRGAACAEMPQGPAHTCMKPQEALKNPLLF